MLDDDEPSGRGSDGGVADGSIADGGTAADAGEPDGGGPAIDGGGGVDAGDIREPTLEEMMAHSQVFGCDLGSEKVRLAFSPDGQLGISEWDGAWSDTGTWRIVADTVELAVAGVVEQIEASEYYQGQIFEFQSPSLDCVIIALPEQTLLAGMTFACNWTGFEQATYSFQMDGGVGRSTEVNFGGDTRLETQSGVYWIDIVAEQIHMAFPLTDRSMDEVVESARVLDDSTFEVLSPLGNVVETCRLQ